MKKSLLRFMLLVTGLLLGVNVTWAYTPALSADYTVAGYKYKAFYNISSENANGMCPTEGDLRFRGAGYGLFNFGSGNRGADVALSVAKDDLLFVEFKDSQGRDVTVNSISHCTANATYTSGDFLAYDVTEDATSVNINIGRGGCIIAILVMEKDNDVATADYTINYQFDAETVKTTTGNAAVGAVINTEASFFVGEVKYFRADGQPENLTVEAGGTTLDVIVRKAETWNYSITSSLGATIFSGTGLEGETVYAPYPRYQLSGTMLYEAAATNKEFRKPFTMTADNLTAEITYESKVENVVFYTEGEDISGANVATNGNIPVRASSAKAATVGNDAVITKLPAGKYMFVVGAFTSKSKDWSNYAAKIGVGTETFTATLSNANLNEITSEEYSLNNDTEIKYLADGSTNDCALDYIYMVKTGDVEPAQTPILTLNGTVGEQVSLTFGVYDTEDEYSVDFGDGNLQTAKVGVNNAGPVDPETGQTTAATVFTGTVAGDGTIKVYGNNDVWYLVSSGAMPTTLDQEKLMNVVQMSISGVNAESVALPAYEKLTQFSFTNSPVKSVDISSVPTLTRIDFYNTTESAFEPQLETIDVSQNVNLETIVVGGNFYKKGMITALDLTNNTMLTQLSAENNKIASITGMPVSLKNIYLSNNELETLTFPEFTTKGTIQIQNNKFTLATLPTKPTVTSNSKYTYAPQPAYEVAETVTELDLSSQLTATGILTESVETTYSFVTGGETPATLVEGTDYEVTAPGKFKFLTAQTEKVHGVMATEAFPKFTGANAYVTTEFTVAPAEPAQTLVLTLNGTVGEQASLTFGVYDTEDEYAVDFGDGNLQTAKVGVNNAGPVDPETGQTTAATVFTGTVAGDGTIKVYGNNDIWYLVSSGAMPTALDQEKLMNVQQMTISGVDVESVALPAYEKLTQFSFTNSPVKSVDIASVPTLTRIDFYNTTESTFEPQLETIDVSKNVNLETIVVGGNFYKKGMITALDLTNNTMLTQLSAENNKIASVTGLPASLKNIYLSNNELETLTFPEFTTKGTIQVQNNKFTLATLPAKPAITSNSKYTYAPQPAYEVAESVTELDLSSQLTATGILTEPATTTYSFKTVSGTALAEGTDYEVTEPGKFKFIKEQTENVYGVMATAAFPKFTGANEYRTTEFTVVPGEPSAISNVNAAKMENGKYYNLQGVEIQKPVKGVYIQNGHKVVMK